MKMGIWPALILVFSLAGCAGGYSSYEPYPYEHPRYYERPWYFYDRVPPQQNSPEVLGSNPGDYNPAMSPRLHPGYVNSDARG
jgi:hypothetical protein